MMSYLRPLYLQPPTLRQSAQDAWLHHLLNLIRENQIICHRRPSLPSPDFFEADVHFLQQTETETESRTIDSASGWFRFNGKIVHVDSNRLSAHLDKFMPIAIQEECFHRGAQMLRKELFLFDAFPLYFRLLWRPEFRHLDIPPILDGENRASILNFLASSGFRTRQDDAEYEQDLVALESAKFRLFEHSEIDIEESYLMKRILRKLENLRVLVMWWGADDAMLNIIGSTCNHLESLDLWRSSSVTDLGLKMLLSRDAGLLLPNQQNNFEFPIDGSSPLCQTLLHLGVKETSITHFGCLAAVMRCPKLEVLNFGHTMVLKAFLNEIGRMERPKLPEKNVQYSLKSLFLPVQSWDGLKEVFGAFPKLEELRIWTTLNQFRNVEAEDMPNVKSLLLGGVQSNRIIEDLLGQIGHQLTSLKLENVMSDVRLPSIGRNCPNLVDLQITNSRLAMLDHRCEEEVGDFFSKLKLLHLFMVQYVTNDENIENEPNQNHFVDVRSPLPPASALHCILSHALALEGLQVTGCPSFDDESLKRILQINPMKKLKRFIMTDVTGQQQDFGGTNLHLNCQSVYRLFDYCKQLQCIGDLRHWNISPSQRREISKRILKETGIKWISTASH